MKKNTPGWVLGFFPGEEHLLSMTKQLKQKGQFFNADGVIRLQDLHDIEVRCRSLWCVQKHRYDQD